LAGGYDRKIKNSSKKAFLLQNGDLIEVIDMFKRRQNFALIAVRITKKADS
jgi:hypothetical protein